MTTLSVAAPLSRWELAAETIAVKIRWFGLLVGYLLVNCGPSPNHQPILNAILALGALYALVDTFFSMRGQVFLGRHPLTISGMEALFIGLLCYSHSGLESSFRYFYLLSLICCAIRHSQRITYITCSLHCLSFLVLYVALPTTSQDPLVLLLTLVILGWVTWACSALSLLLKRVSDHLTDLNAALRENQTQLEARIAERTRQLQEAQAHVLHQEKMATFGLLAAGIAHEVGNPLTSVSTIVQILKRRDCDSYTREKLALVHGQLLRIRTILSELISFGRPSGSRKARLDLAEVLRVSLEIAKYYKRIKSRKITLDIPANVPAIDGVRDQLIQAILNVLLNAVDATDNGGTITLRIRTECEWVILAVADDGAGVAPVDASRLFKPYFTTKKQGTGLGLFVTHRLVTDHGGAVEYCANSPTGAVFSIRLPIAVAQVDGANVPCDQPFDATTAMTK